jgi:hypothetical protein
MYVVLSCLLRNLLYYVHCCVGDGLNGLNILFLLHSCALFRYFPFLIRWVSLIGIHIPLKEAQHLFNDLTGKSFDRRNILFSLHRCALSHYV